MKPILKSIVLSVEDVAAILHALVGYYRIQEQVIPDIGMLLVSRFTALHSEMIQEEAQAFLYSDRNNSGGLGA